MTALNPLSAAVTRILSLTGFPVSVKTKDVQSAFSEWEQVSGGFKIKWRDDTSLYIVFMDPCVAKRAYLKALAYPPPILTSSSTGVKATLIPYNGTEAQSVLAAVQARAGHNVNASRSGISQHSGRSQSISTFPAHRPSFSKNDSSPQLNVSYEADAVIPRSNGNGNGHIGREPSPTLPNLPSHPTLNELINSASSSPQIEPPSFLAAATAGNAAQPRIGDPGKRMVGHALGVRHPSLTSRAMSGGTPLGIERPLAAVILND